MKLKFLMIGIVLGFIEIFLVLVALLGDVESPTRLIVRSPFFTSAVFVGSITSAITFASMINNRRIIQICLFVIFGILTPLAYILTIRMIYDGGFNYLGEPYKSINDISEFLGYINGAGWFLSLTYLPIRVIIHLIKKRKSNRKSNENVIKSN